MLRISALITSNKQCFYFGLVIFSVYNRKCYKLNLSCGFLILHFIFFLWLKYYVHLTIYNFKLKKNMNFRQNIVFVFKIFRLIFKVHQKRVEVFSDSAKKNIEKTFNRYKILENKQKFVYRAIIFVGSSQLWPPPHSINFLFVDPTP